MQPGAVSIIESVKARVKFDLPLFFKRLKSPRRQRYFHRQWGARGIIASVSSGQLALNIWFCVPWCRVSFVGCTAQGPVCFCSRHLTCLGFWVGNFCER